MSKDKYLYDLVSDQKYLIGQTNVTNDNLTPQSEHLLCTLHRIKPATGLTPSHSLTVHEIVGLVGIKSLWAFIGKYPFAYLLLHETSY